MKEVFVNSRILAVKSNGQKRVAEELIQRMAELKTISPPTQFRSGMKGHLWEQTALPMETMGHALWSPSTSGPLLHPNHIVTIHDIAFVDVVQFFGKSFALWYAQLIGRLAKRARHVISVSEFTRVRLIEHYGVREDQITTVHSGASKSFVPQGKEHVAAARERYALGSAPYFVAFSGNDPRKNTARLLHAWKRSGVWKQEAKLVLFGRKAQASVFAAEEQLDEVPGVIEVGSISDQTLATIFSGAHGFVFPSLYEGFGLPVVEAARCGCRVITSNLSAMPEVSPSDALLVNPEAIDEIAEAMSTLAHRDDDPVLAELRMREMDRFDWDLAATRYREIFQSKFA